ncbi:MAG TPA: DUF1003 domain-containing protein [Actinocatenispora sp.]
MPDRVPRRSPEQATAAGRPEPTPARVRPPERRGTRLDQPRVPGRIRLPRWDADSFGRFAEATARFMGTAQFLVVMTVIVVLWVAINLVGLWGLRWDPYPFILLNLFFSTQASYAAPLILLAQNRQADRDRLTMDEDRRRAAAQKADTDYLAREIAALRIALGEVATRDFVRSELARLLEEMDRRDGHHPVPASDTAPGQGT